MPASSSFVDPSSLSLPSPSHSPSPAPESSLPTTSTANLQSASASSTTSAQPSRKRPRTETSSEERKEARAHRNRIAAQNSRDRRKAQFQLLERRVAELEEENRVLRASISLASISAGHNIAAAPVARPKLTPAEEQREKENQELKERIRTLEKGWDAVVKALAAQGLPTGISLSGPEASTSTPTAQTASLPTPTALTPPSSSAKSSSPASAVITKVEAPESPAKLRDSTSLPSLTSAPLGFPLSPAPSDSSLDSFDIDMEFELSSSASTSSLFASDFKSPEQSKQTTHEQLLTTRHLARVATTAVKAVSLQRVVNSRTMEILAASPSLPTKSLPDTTEGDALSGLPAPSAAQMIIPDFTAGAGVGVNEGAVEGVSVGMNGSSGSTDVGMSNVAMSLYNWVDEAEMKKLLDMLPSIEGVGEAVPWDSTMLSAMSTIGV
ncbi:hypothetical protein CCMSSC00406_0003990 [Pleurotus cornucopiae]|uniref:Uncharacterized protein n=1 Tax=Pleurotus cornucopiae TaxID=5321 RepID=A0ACB7IRY8_PLECO|nr:hypothetical protein CCMSSC00406_0003990 [Pleurotus cornucopiae]